MVSLSIDHKLCESVCLQVLRNLNDSFHVSLCDILLRSASRFHSLSGSVDHGLEQGRGQRGTGGCQSVQWLGVGVSPTTWYLNEVYAVTVYSNASN